MSTAGHEIDVTDLVHPAQVWVINLQLYDDPLRIELEPALIVKRYLGHHEIARETLRSHHPPLWALERLAAHEQLAVGKLHDRMQHTLDRRFRTFALELDLRFRIGIPDPP